MSAMGILNEIHNLLSQYRYDFCSEADLGNAISQILLSAGYQIEKEYRLTAADRLDLLVNCNIAIEIKIAGSIPAVMRQVARYAEHPAIIAILLVTARSHHTLPDSFNGKPLKVLSLVDGQL